MTEKDFRQEFQTGKHIGSSNLLCDTKVYHYACEVWQSMTEEEKANTTTEKMLAYVQDTIEAMEEDKEEAMTEEKACPFCEELRKVKETHDWYKSNSPRHADTRVEYKAALVTESYQDGVDYCTGTTTYQQKELNFCPVCGTSLKEVLESQEQNKGEK